MSAINTRIAFAMLVVVASAALAFAQANVRVGTPVIQGENPYIRLLDKADGRTLTRVSF